jgi:cytochrome c oxidase subunit 2
MNLKKFHKKYFSKKSFLPLTLLISTLTLLSFIGCVSTNPQSTFDVHGPVAQSQLVLFYWILGAATFVFIAMTMILLYTVYKFRRKPEDQLPEPLYPEQIHGNKKLEIAWTIIPFIILGIIAVPTIITIFDNTNSPDNSRNAITVDVYAHQWFWEFKYEDPNNDSGNITIANEMHIPVGKVVNINLHSDDVIHSFWIPKLAGKVDVMPGNNNHMWIQADKEGEYRGLCAEFCGIAHALMKFRVIAESQENYDKWLLAQSTEAIESVEPQALEGKQIFESRDAGCWSCHTIRGSSRSKGKTGPDLTHMASRTHIAAGVVENTQENLTKWIENPNSIKPGTIMATNGQVYNDPDKKLTGPEISAIVAYLRTLE